MSVCPCVSWAELRARQQHSSSHPAPAMGSPADSKAAPHPNNPGRNGRSHCRSLSADVPEARAASKGHRAAHGHGGLLLSQRCSCSRAAQLVQNLLEKTRSKTKQIWVHSQHLHIPQSWRRSTAPAVGADLALLSASMPQESRLHVLGAFIRCCNFSSLLLSLTEMNFKLY